LVCANGLSKRLDKNIKILYSTDKEEYFKDLTNTLEPRMFSGPSERTGILCGSRNPDNNGASLGSQEVYNRTWLKTIGAGISQNNPATPVNADRLVEGLARGSGDGRIFGRTPVWSF